MAVLKGLVHSQTCRVIFRVRQCRVWRTGESAMCFCAGWCVRFKGTSARSMGRFRFDISKGSSLPEIRVRLVVHVRTFITVVCTALHSPPRRYGSLFYPFSVWPTGPYLPSLGFPADSNFLPMHPQSCDSPELIQHCRRLQQPIRTVRRVKPRGGVHRGWNRSPRLETRFPQPKSILPS